MYPVIEEATTDCRVNLQKNSRRIFLILVQRLCSLYVISVIGSYFEIATLVIFQIFLFLAYLQFTHSPSFVALSL